MALLTAGAPATGRAAVMGFTNQPAQNSVKWQNRLPSRAASERIDFEDHPLGSFNGSLYQPTHGATFSINNQDGPLPYHVQSGAGPGEWRTDGASTGEGLHAPSNYLGFSRYTALSSTTRPARFDITFDEPVLGAGLFTIDLYRTSGLSLTAFDHPDPDHPDAGQLGTFGRPAQGTNTYQEDQLYFMGVIDEERRIRSVRLTYGASRLDSMGVDDVMIASEIPAPGALSVLGLGGLGMLAARRRPRPGARLIARGS
jgi:hypothetical protein